MDDITTKPSFLGTTIDAMNFHIFERKYELDSIVAVMKLSVEYYEATGDTSVFNSNWTLAIETILNTIQVQQGGSTEYNPYFFQRTTTVPTDTLMFGTGAPANRCGLSKSPFRPSDDATTFPFLIPSNAFAVVYLRAISKLLPSNLAQFAQDLANQIDMAIQQYAIINHPAYGQVYAYEIDGYGNFIIMDDANIPSLFSLPYLGYVSNSDPVYLRTRNVLWSSRNPYFFSGSAGSGIGGPHDGLGWIWPMSIIMKALTSDNDTEIMDCLNLLIQASAGTGFMHESFWLDNVGSYTRPWFGWANSLFGELIINIAETKPYLIFNS